MKKIFFYIVCLILFCCFLLLGYLFYNIRCNLNNNIKVLEFMDNFIISNNFSDLNNNYFKISINNKDYIGKISISNDNLVLPVESSCHNAYFKIMPVCLLESSHLIIMGSSFEDGFYNYKLYEVNDKVSFYNTLGGVSDYKVVSVSRVNSISDVFNFDNDLLIVVMNYLSLEYVVFECDKI